MNGIDAAIILGGLAVVAVAGFLLASFPLYQSSRHFFLKGNATLHEWMDFVMLRRRELQREFLRREFRNFFA